MISSGPPGSSSSSELLSAVDPDGGGGRCGQEPAAGRREGPARRRQEAPLPADAAGRRPAFHTHVGHRRPRRPDRRLRGIDGLRAAPGRRFLVVRPTLAEMVLKMPRGAQVIYPKDLAAILMEADIAPGMTVLEAGVGSGALSMALLRAGASVVGYELREDFADRARSNVAAMVGDDADYRVELRDVYEGIEERGLDRIVLDLPEPWRVRRPCRGGPAVGRHRSAPTCRPSTRRPTSASALEDSAFGMAGHPRGAAPDVAHRGPLGPARPPHGRPHRIPHHGPPPAPRGAGEPSRRADRLGARSRGRRTGTASTRTIGPPGPTSTTPASSTGRPTRRVAGTGPVG